jgi:hypothetical protein
MADDTGAKHDVIHLSRHLLNCAATNQTISKQECMVLVGGLDLVKCSETIETVSISGQYAFNQKRQIHYSSNMRNIQPYSIICHWTSFLIMCTTEEAMLLFHTMLVEEANLCIQLLRDMHEPVL